MGWCRNKSIGSMIRQTSLHSYITLEVIYLLIFSSVIWEDDDTYFKRLLCLNEYLHERLAMFLLVPQILFCAFSFLYEIKSVIPKCQNVEF